MFNWDRKLQQGRLEARNHALHLKVNRKAIKNDYEFKKIINNQIIFNK